MRTSDFLAALLGLSLIIGSAPAIMAEEVIFSDDFNDDSGTLLGQTAVSGQTWYGDYPTWVGGDLGTGTAYGQGGTVGAGYAATGHRGNDVKIGDNIFTKYCLYGIGGTYTVSVDLHKGWTSGMGLELLDGGVAAASIIWEGNRLSLGGVWDIWNIGSMLVDTGGYGGQIHVDLTIEVDADPEIPNSTATLSYYGIADVDGNPYAPGTEPTGSIVGNTDSRNFAYNGITLWSEYTGAPPTSPEITAGFDNVHVVKRFSYEDKPVPTGILSDNFNDGSGSLLGKTTTTGSRTWVTAVPGGIAGDLSTGTEYGQDSTLGTGDAEASDVLTSRGNTVPIGPTLRDGTYVIGVDIKKIGGSGGGPDTPEAVLELASADGLETVSIIWFQNQMNIGGSLWSGAAGASTEPPPQWGGDVHAELTLVLDGDDPGGASTATLDWYALGPYQGGNVPAGGTTGPIPITWWDPNGNSVFDGLVNLTLSTTTMNGGTIGFDNLTVGIIGELPPEDIPGDANRDGRVDDLDAKTLAANWGQAGSWTMGDFDGDGKVNAVDASILAANWGYGTSESAAVPEPGAVGLILAGLLGLSVLRRK